MMLLSRDQRSLIYWLLHVKVICFGLHFIILAKYRQFRHHHLWEIVSVFGNIVEFWFHFEMTGFPDFGFSLCMEVYFCLDKRSGPDASLFYSSGTKKVW